MSVTGCPPSGNDHHNRRHRQNRRTGNSGRARCVVLSTTLGRHHATMALGAASLPRVIAGLDWFGLITTVAVGTSEWPGSAGC
jgi:hypothetical protein